MLHQKFSTHWIENEWIQKELELGLKPTIRSCDQEFIDNCFSKLKDFVSL